MNRFVASAILAIIFSAVPAGAQPGQLDASPTLFTVMAALDASGYSPDVSSPNNHPIRQQVRSEILRRNPASLVALKEFFASRRRRTDTEDLSQYVSFALSVKGPPEFEFTQRDVDIPPDVVPLKELSTLLAVFYREAGIEELWKRSQPAVDQYVGLYHRGVSESVLQANAYLRQMTSGFRGRTFQIFVEVLAPPNQVQTRSYGNDYTIVVTPSPEPRIFEIRHAYLHYLLDPLSTLNREILDRKKPIAEHALRAGALDESFKEDFLLLATESLIKAVEARLDRKPAGVQEALQQGYILAPYFAEQLPRYEKQELPMSGYYAEMVKSIDLRREDARLTGVEFDRAPKPAAVVRSEAPAPPALSGAAKALSEADRAYEQRGADAANLERAKELYLEVLQQTAEKPAQASAYYGLARIAALQKDPAAAEELFSKTLESAPDSQVRAWSLVYLGRLELAAGNREQAALKFQEALKVDGASEMARKAAAEGLQNSTNR